MAGWVVRIRQVTTETVAADGTLVGMRRGPVVTTEVRRYEDLLPEVWHRVLAPPTDLPLHTRAGPCGTLSRRPIYGGGWAMRWCTLYLVAPLRAYYSAYEPPMRFGAKPGPRGRKAA